MVAIARFRCPHSYYKSTISSHALLPNTTLYKVETTLIKSFLQVFGSNKNSLKIQKQVMQFKIK